MKPKEEKKGEAKVEAKQEQPKKLDFISALKATTVEEPKKSHAQIMKESLGAASESNAHNIALQQSASASE